MKASVVDLALCVSHYREDDLLKIAVARGTTHHDFELARFHHELHVNVVERKLLGRDFERDAFGLAWFQENLTERLQFLNGPRGRTHEIANVHLYHFAPGARACVGHRSEEHTSE